MQTETFTGDSIRHMSRNYRRTFVNMLTGFKSAHLVGTVSQEGDYNLAIFNSVTHIGANPALMGCIFRPLTVPRHTYNNIRQSGYFTFNHVNQQMLPAAHQTSAKYPEDVSEFDVCGFHPLMSERHPAPYVAESRIRIGLKYREEHLVAANGTVMMIGEIVEVQMEKDLVDSEGFIDHEQAETTAISGLDTYYLAQKIHRLGYARPEKK